LELTHTTAIFIGHVLGIRQAIRDLQGRNLENTDQVVTHSNYPWISGTRLWIGLSNSTVWVPIAINPKNHDFTYAASGSLESGWFNGGFKEINKFWKSVQVYAENLRHW
jgi:hypothetical protein